MKILIAPDSFKHSLTAKEAAQSVYKGAKHVFPEIEAEIVPLSDGGEGFTEAILEGAGGQFKKVETHDALMRKIEARIGIIDEGRTAVIELAVAAGIEHLTKDELNPWIATTYGVGELIKAGLDHGCKKLIVGLGGSATNDAGVGMAQALGIKFLNTKGQEIGCGGGEVGNIVRIDTSYVDSRLKNVEILVACDVTNILYGKEGASMVYGPQKGADMEMVQKLDQHLEHYAKLLSVVTSRDIGSIPGSGAAGGTAASLMAFFNATLVPGFNVVKEVTQLEKKIKWCDLVITGEGKMDFQTKFGKAPHSIAQLASRYNKPVVAFAGTLGNGYEALLEDGFSFIIEITTKSMLLEDALKNAKILLEQASERFFKNYQPGSSIQL